MTDRPAVLFGQRLRNARERLGLTQKQIADLAYTTASGISQYESGLRTPRLDIALTIAHAAGFSLDGLGGIPEAPDGVHVRSMLDARGRPVEFAVSGGAVIIRAPVAELDGELAEEFAAFFVATARSAAVQAEIRATAAAEEMCLADCGAKTHDNHCRETTDA